MTFNDEITAFFKGYVDAFARDDADGLSEMWDPVGLFPSPSGNFAMERPAFRDHCVALLDFYRSQGVVRPAGELLMASEIFPDVAEARMSYQMRGADDEIVAEWEHFYILRRAGGRWRITLTIADAEMAAWAARGATL